MVNVGNNTFVASYIALYIFLLQLVGFVSAAKHEGKENCQGSDICYTYEHDSSDYIISDVTEPFKLKIDFNGIFTELDEEKYSKLVKQSHLDGASDEDNIQYSNLSKIEERGLNKRLGLDACCNGLVDDAPRRSGDISDDVSTSEKRQMPTYEQYLQAL
ncbi:hypothetical protein WALSEDRAFT_66574 [Wallemia mellicola CBS 633.66]|uniref:Uncharacterized protein n=1 Tax=Wallemia mellicola (strain ATCC MYA-4683 / CBS 633.66) TaxID=671144 RepID=I4Y5D6_WALMC|nr:hypothetical protein WALSEDRAFT_66574 [Wallemia mellicola CBS 633.66]EIM19178.1 hypothetical protein WALSEDRAFT_66574 [Wallemia mellicola CBS 633.66]|eukprot:XP_006960750.1 hypothetical protein WALSEDRAFT_66574 [Wallemia mellicola CBS 633.66]